MPRKPKVQPAGEGQTIRCKVHVSPDEEQTKMQSEFQGLARKIVSGLSDLEPAQGKALLDSFVSELFISVAKREMRETRHRQQAEGIAAAKARGVQLGRSPKPLPDNFEEYYQKWLNGEISMREAALACGMSKTWFRDAVMRKERLADFAV